jgi:hypothetical protein
VGRGSGWAAAQRVLPHLPRVCVTRRWPCLERGLMWRRGAATLLVVVVVVVPLVVVAMVQEVVVVEAVEDERAAPRVPLPLSWHPQGVVAVVVVEVVEGGVEVGVEVVAPARTVSKVWTAV